MLCDDLLAIAESAGLRRVSSCCNTHGKFCSSDEWRGNLSAFANALITHHQSTEPEPVPSPAPGETK